MSRAEPVAASGVSGVAAVELERISFRYPGTDRPAIDRLTLKVEAGETLVLLGRSGSGKTSLLRVIEGSLDPSEGRVRRAGRACLVYQDRRLVSQRSVLENATSGALRERGAFALRASSAQKERAHEILADLGLGEVASRRVSTLSGGLLQRVAIARALCAEPAVLLADEPLASLDPSNAERVLDVLERLQRKYGFSLILTMHEVAVAERRFSRIEVVESGRLRPFTGSPAASELEEQKEPEQERSLDSRIKALPGAGVMMAALVAALLLAAVGLNLRGFVPGKFLPSLWQFLSGLLPSSWAAVAAMPFAQLFWSLIETIQMAVLGTAAGIVVALPLAIFASDQTAAPSVRVPTRLLLNGIRTIPSIFWALIFVALVGLGPAAGVGALAAYSVGYLTKFFYEALEDVDPRPARALEGLGLSRFQSFVLALWPASQPAVAAACFFVLEYNIRGASVLGVVGAGGIGQDLMYYFDYREFPTAALGLLMVLAVVVALDLVSQRLRRTLSMRRGQ